MHDLPAVRYEYSEDVRGQLACLDYIDELEAAASRERLALWERLTLRDRHGKPFLSAEVLVVVLRRFLARDDVDAAQRVAEELLERWAVYIRRIAWRWFPDSESDREDMVQEIHTRLWQTLINPRQGFWEVNFIHALRCLCIDVGSGMRPRHPDPLPMAPSEREDSAPILTRVLRKELREWIDAAILALPPQQQRAIFLRYIEDLPIYRKDPLVFTVTSIMGVGSRTIRNYLRDGIEALRQVCDKEALHV